MYHPYFYESHYDYEEVKNYNYANIVSGFVIIIVNIMAILSLTVMCNENSFVREIPLKYYDYILKFTYIMFIIGIVGVFLNFIPFTKPVINFILPLTTSIGMILLSYVSSSYASETYKAIKDITCNTNKNSSLQVSGVSVLAGCVLLYVGLQ